VEHVFVGGIPVVEHGRVREGSVPGRAIRAPLE
jgi:hypothetical protein